jgi:tetratricopeptide (TPR) repeat protein
MNGDYLSAVSALEKSVKITPDYSNAKYFLGLSYFKTGQSQKSIKEFQDIERLNPDRTDIAGIIKNIKTGNSPISDSVTKETPSNKTATSSLMKTLSSSPETPAETQ